MVGSWRAHRKSTKVIDMEITFVPYNEAVDLHVLKMVMAAYQWEDHPSFGYSRFLFSKGLHPAFTGHRHAWEQSAGLFRVDGEFASCLINEGVHSGETFFLFADRRWAEDERLLDVMLLHAKTFSAAVREDRKTRHADLHIPHWNAPLRERAMEHGFRATDGSCKQWVLEFKREARDAPRLPDGYRFVDGTQTSGMDLANVHRQSFAYGGDTTPCINGSRAFEELRLVDGYNPFLDLAVLDPLDRPVGIAVVWQHDDLEYCELEPMAVTWWNRRRGIGRALIAEAERRVLSIQPDCKGLLGGDQRFYEATGFVLRSETPIYHWELDVPISWESESGARRFFHEVNVPAQGTRRAP